ncbi:unnamed protein product [Arctogadus glacialis]
MPSYFFRLRVALSFFVIHVFASLYSVRAPLSLWHVDTNHKLIRYNIVLFGAVGGYSRKIMCLNAATNNLASTAFAAFKQATERHGIPSSESQESKE